MSVEVCICNQSRGIICWHCFRQSFGLPPLELKTNNKRVFIKTPLDHIKYNSHIPKPGMKFGKLTAIDRRSSYSKTYWKCMCDCGKEVRRVSRLDLLNGIVNQCRDCDNKSRITDIFDNSTIVPLHVLENQ
jgi:hypothetical protein